MAIYETRNTGTGNGMWGMRETWGMFSRIRGNLLEDSEEYYYFNIPRNVEEDSGECSRTFRGMLVKIPRNAQEDSRERLKSFRGMFRKIQGNVQEDSGECSKRFRGTLKKILGNVQKDCRECSRGFRGKVQEDSGESKFRFSLWNLAYFSSNSAIKLRQNKEIFSRRLLTTYN